MNHFDREKYIGLKMDEYLNFKLESKYLPDNECHMETKAGHRVTNVNKGLRTKFMRQWKNSKERIDDIGTFVRLRSYEEYKQIMDMKELIFSKDDLALYEHRISDYLNEDEFNIAHEIFSNALANGMTDRYGYIFIDRKELV